MKTTHEKKIFRKNVAVFVLNASGKILCCHRSDIEGAWQVPQGGIEADETEEEALFRELDEEIGTNDVEVLSKLPTPIRYEWPKELHNRGFHGQEQVYFLVRLKNEEAINLQKNEPHIEFDKYEWLNAKDFLSRVSGFKKDAYQLALQMFQDHYPNLK